MVAKLLKQKAVARPWGRRKLPSGFESFEADEPIGEIWHEPVGGDDAPLLVKHLFTADRLSIQVHPDDAAARERGLPRGKDEAWLILGAEAGACIGIGLMRSAAEDELREAALSGAIEQLVDWRRVQAGDFLYSPGGTIHAIGPGLSLIEIQQNLDLTYRLYDYGRPRELHLEEGIAVADRDVWVPTPPSEPRIGNRHILASGSAFVTEAWQVSGRSRIVGATPGSVIVHRSGSGRIGDATINPGSVWSLEGDAELHGELELLIAYPGSGPVEGLRQDA